MIRKDTLHEAAHELTRRAAIEIPSDYLSGLEAMAEKESEDLSSFVLRAMLENYKAAKDFTDRVKTKALGQDVINSISPEKDVDGFHISNVGLLGTGQKSMVPCTPLGCLMMLRDHHGSLSGLDAVVVGLPHNAPDSQGARVR